ncbi:MAG: condensation domain-containing protein [Candidatus Azobacteroides sp.]|nr:condensation domain-containing protein [Candidatus Azobacteroides sp.]
MEIKRKLFYIERMLFLNGIRSVDPLTLIIHAAFAGNIPEERVRLALDKLQKRHPALRARITEGKYIHYEDTDYPPIPLRIAERVSDNTWKTEKEKLIAEPFVFEKGPFVRLLWVRSKERSEFVFIGLHVIIDGKSLYELLKEFHILINEPDREMKPYPPILSMKELLPEVTLNWKQKLIGNVYTEYMRWQLFSSVRGKKIQHYKRYILPLVLDRETSGALNKIAEKSKVSVGSIFCIIVAELFIKHIHPQKPKCIISLAVDLRRYTTSLKKDMLWAFAPLIRLLFQTSDHTDVLEEARSFEKSVVERALKEQKEKNLPIKRSITTGIVFSEYFNRVIKLMVKRNLTVNDGSDFNFINLGVFTTPLKNPEFEIISSLAPPEIRSPWFNSTFFGVGSDRNMTHEFIFASNESFIPREKMEAIRSEFEQSVKELIKEYIVKNENSSI